MLYYNVIHLKPTYLFLLFSFLVLTKCQVLNLTVGRSRDQVLQRAYSHAVDASFSPYGHPTQVDTSWSQINCICVKVTALPADLRIRLAILGKSLRTIWLWKLAPLTCIDLRVRFTRTLRIKRIAFLTRVFFSFLAPKRLRFVRKFTHQHQSLQGLAFYCIERGIWWNTTDLIARAFS